jgi:hypothetical protein
MTQDNNSQKTELTEERIREIVREEITLAAVRNMVELLDVDVRFAHIKDNLLRHKKVAD